MPVCTDLLTIGDDTVIRKDAVFPCYRAHAGAIHTGAVTLGKGVVVGELAVLDIDTSLGDGAQLGHASSLRPGQAVPAGERWHGSPAQPTEVDYRSVGPARCGAVRRATHAVTQLLTALLVFLPLTTGVAVYVLADFPLLAGLDTAPLAFTTWTFYRDALIVVGRAVLRFRNRWPARGVHRSARAQPRDQAGQGLPPLRLPLLDPPDDRAAHQRQVLHLPLRRQLLHRLLPACPGIRPVDRRADRIQFRHRSAPRDPVPRLGGARNNGRRRAVGHQRRLLQHVLPAVPGVHRGPQLPRQRHRLSRPEPCRRELSARHEGPDSRSTGRSATASGCSARPASRSRAPSTGTAGSAR